MMENVGSFTIMHRTRRKICLGINMKPNLIELEVKFRINTLKQTTWFFCFILATILKPNRIIKSNVNLPRQEFLQAHFDALMKC